MGEEPCGGWESGDWEEELEGIKGQEGLKGLEGLEGLEQLDVGRVYLGALTDLRYQGTTINGWDPAVTTYNMEMAGEPDLYDFTATVEGVSAVLTKSMEQNADGSYRIAISVVSADLQNAACYIINVTAPAGIPGDVDNDGKRSIADVTALIKYLLSHNSEGINLQNADVDGDSHITIGDVTTLINMLLRGL